MIRQASAADSAQVSAVLQEAARWLEERGTPMWRGDELQPDRIAAAVAAGEFFVAECDGAVAGTLKFQLEDKLFWPDVPPDEAAFIHRLAVRRVFAGGAVSAALMNWAVERARQLDKKFLRLDCEASRSRLRAVYERFGFHHHSDRIVGPYHVARYEFPLAQHR
ncbi:MAG: GNAT family N-acetyltransferase [Kiritimatiellaeota bacterium]|nr:GNAT family N-acetyltransferase [Kiritimatiellota bacterium]